MSALLESIRVWIEQIIMAFGYAGIAVAMFVENLFPPVPSEVVLLFSGFLVKAGEFSFLGVLLASVTGSVAGAVAIYYIGVLFDESMLRGFVQRYGRFLLVSEANLDQALAIFDRHGEKMVFLGRMIPLVRSLISVPAGLTRMPFRRFITLTALGSAIWNALLCGAGVLLGQNWESMLVLVDRYENLVLITLALVVVVWVGRALWRVAFSTDRPRLPAPPTLEAAAVPIENPSQYNGEQLPITVSASDAEEER